MSAPPTNEDNVFKSSATPSGFRGEISSDLEKNLLKFSDPVVLGELLYKLIEERENTNRILKNILAKLEELGAGAQTSALRDRAAELQMLLPEIDEDIIKYLREAGKATAEDVRQKFNYKGKNAASARLNHLYALELLEKRQVGKKVFFFPK